MARIAVTPRGLALRERPPTRVMTTPLPPSVVSAGSTSSPLLFPQAFGAKVDGATDDSAAWASAITAASNIGVAQGSFCELYVPAGVSLAHGLSGASWVRLVGPGTIRMNAATDLFTVNTSRFEIDGPTLDANNQAANLITYQQCALCYIRRAKLLNVNNNGTSWAVRYTFGGQTQKEIVNCRITYQGTPPSTTGLIAFEGVGSRTVTDCATTNGQAQITSATASFVNANAPAGDIGKGVTIGGYGSGIIPDGTTIISVQSATQATLSNNVTGTLTGQTILIGTTFTGDTLLSGIWTGGADLADLTGCATVLITNGNWRNVYFATDTKKVCIFGNRIANSNVASTTVDGTNHIIMGNVAFSPFTIASTCKNSIVGPNVNSQGPNTNNASTVSLIDAFNGNTLPPYSRNVGLPGYITPQPQALMQMPSTTITATANLAYINRLVVSEPTIVTKIAFYVITAAGSNDNIDVGIYDSGGNRLTSIGSTASLVNSTGLKTVSPTSITLLPGLVYWVALAYGTIGTSAAAFSGVSLQSNNQLPLFGTGTNLPFGSVASSFPLPATITAGQGALASTPTLAVRTN